MKVGVVDVESVQTFFAAVVANAKQTLTTNIEPQSDVIQLPFRGNVECTGLKAMHAGDIWPTHAPFDWRAIEHPVIELSQIPVVPGRDLVAAPAKAREPFLNRKKRVHRSTLASANAQTDSDPLRDKVS